MGPEHSFKNGTKYLLAVFKDLFCKKEPFSQETPTWLWADTLVVFNGKHIEYHQLYVEDFSQLIWSLLWSLMVTV